MWGLKGFWGGGWGEEEGEANYSPAGAAPGAGGAGADPRLEGTSVWPTPLVVPGQLPRRLLTSFFMSWGRAKPLTSSGTPWRLPLVFSPCPAPALGTYGSFPHAGNLRPGESFNGRASLCSHVLLGDDKEIGYFWSTA